MSSHSPTNDDAMAVHQRAEDLLGQMTPAERAGQLTQYFYFGSMPDQESLDDLGPLPQPDVIEAVLRRGEVGSLLFITDPTETNRLQRIAVEETRLRIPLLFGFDVIHGFRTVFPVPIGMAASWDTQLIERAQSIAAREARAVGIHWAFAPMVDIARDPRWGRMIEGAGEDPCLGAAVAAAQVRGFQGEAIGQEERLISGPKHFAGYGACLGGRDYDEVNLSDYELWNVHLPPFEAAIKARCGNVMSAYMDLNGIPATGNNWLFTDVLRETWRFNGFVVSDANAVRDLVTHGFARDLPDAAVRALNAGVDMEMAIADPAFESLPNAFEKGQISEDDLNASARRVLEAKIRMGLFEDPYVDESAQRKFLMTPGIELNRALRRNVRRCFSRTSRSCYRST
jgi:beta-glucosidase